MFTPKPDTGNGFNTYVEHSLKTGEYAVDLEKFIRGLFMSEVDSRYKDVKLFCAAPVDCDDNQRYLNEYIKSNTLIHVYVMVPGTNIFGMIHDIIKSKDADHCVYVIMSQIHELPKYLKCDGWTGDELNGLQLLKKKLQTSGVVVLDSLDKLAPTIDYVISSTSPGTVYRGDTETSSRSTFVI